MCKFVDEKILKNEELSFLNDLTNLYTFVLAETRGAEYEDTVFTSQSQELGEKLNAYYDRKISMDSGNKKQCNIVFSAKIKC